MTDTKSKLKIKVKRCNGCNGKYIFLWWKNIDKNDIIIFKLTLCHILKSNRGENYAIKRI